MRSISFAIVARLCPPRQTPDWWEFQSVFIHRKTAVEKATTNEDTAEGIGPGYSQFKTMKTHFTAEMLDSYQRDGYLLVEDLISPEETAALRERIREYTHGGRSQAALHIQIEPRVQRGEVTVAHP